MQDWELCKNRCILTQNGNHVIYQTERDELILPKWQNEEDKILGVLGMLSYSEYIIFSEDIISRKEILKNIFKVSTIYNDNGLLISELSIKMI